MIPNIHVNFAHTNANLIVIRVTFAKPGLPNENPKFKAKSKFFSGNARRLKIEKMIN